MSKIIVRKPNPVLGRVFWKERKKAEIKSNKESEYIDSNTESSPPVSEADFPMGFLSTSDFDVEES